MTRNSLEEKTPRSRLAQQALYGPVNTTTKFTIPLLVLIFDNSVTLLLLLYLYLGLKIWFLSLALVYIISSFNSSVLLDSFYRTQVYPGSDLGVYN